MDADGQNQIRLTDNGRHNWFPHISPDNSTIVYISYDPSEVSPGDHPADKHVQIRQMDPDGAHDHCLVSFFGGQGSFNVNSFAPDGKTFAYIRYVLTE